MKFENNNRSKPLFDNSLQKIKYIFTNKSLMAKHAELIFLQCVNVIIWTLKNITLDGWRNLEQSYFLTFILATNNLWASLLLSQLKRTGALTRAWTHTLSDTFCPKYSPCTLWVCSLIIYISYFSAKTNFGPMGTRERFTIL